MQTVLWFDRFPQWVIFWGTVSVVIVSLVAGFGIGLWRRQKLSDLSGPEGAVVAALLGLLAFILAFTFGSAASRFDARKQLLLDEVNAIETAYFRAGMIAEPQRTKCRQMLEDYVNLRASISLRGPALGATLARSEELQKELWRQAVALAQVNTSSEIDALFIEALNRVIEIHRLRVAAGLQYRIPPGLWNILFLLTSLTMVSVGYQFGRCGKNSFMIYFFLAVSFSLIIGLIIDLDNPARGGVTVSQRPMIDLQQRLSVSRG